MARTDLSRPVALALQDQVLTDGMSVFDYGCGRGGDVERLVTLGFEASGWDPVHAPVTDQQSAEFVNLGYVINVIEQPRERVEALQAAWKLARKVLVIAARPEWEERSVSFAHPKGDGIVTR